MKEDVENAVVEFTNYTAKIHKQIGSVLSKSIIICRLSARNA
jgi:hypothetical protein